MKNKAASNAIGAQTHQDIPFWLVPVLLPFSLLYAVGLEIYLLPYKIGLRKRYKLPCRVVCVGNLTFGGTGKSPAVRSICNELLKRGFHPGVLSRGHGGRLCKVGAIASDGNKRLLSAEDCGDEPALLADALREVPLAVGKDRRKSGSMLFEEFYPDIIVLDDGMQYWQLHRDVEIALVNASRPFGSGLLMPAGTLREPVKNIKRAHAIVITGAESVDDDHVNRLMKHLGKRAPGSELFVARRRPATVIDWSSQEKHSLDILKGLPIVAVSGIANPSSFETMLERLGADIRECLRFGDHCSYAGSQQDEIRDAMNRTGAAAVVTTVKDAVKLNNCDRLYVLDIELQVENMDRLVDLVIGDARSSK